MAMAIGTQIVTNHRFRMTDYKQGQVQLFLIVRIFRIDSWTETAHTTIIAYKNWEMWAEQTQRAKLASYSVHWIPFMINDSDCYIVLADYLSGSICSLSTSIHHRFHARPLLDLRNSVAIIEILCQAVSSLSRLLSRNTDPFPGWTLNRWSMSVRRSIEYL